jgi:hypothetical protein
MAFDFNKNITVNGRQVPAKQAIRAFLPVLLEILQEWDGYSLENYLKFKLGDRKSQFKNMEDDGTTR